MIMIIIITAHFSSTHTEFRLSLAVRSHLSFHLFLFGNIVVPVTMVQAGDMYARHAERAALTCGRLVHIVTWTVCM